MTDDALWKRRFLLFSLVRVGGVAMILLGVATAFSDLLVAGGSRHIGAVLIALGTIEMVVVPLILRARWDKQ